MSLFWLEYDTHPSMSLLTVPGLSTMQHLCPEASLINLGSAVVTESLLDLAIKLLIIFRFENNMAFRNLSFRCAPMA